MSSIPISAPVSRSIAGSNGARHDGNGRVTLSAEERDMAHKSYKHLAPAEAERAYAIGKLKYQRSDYQRDGR